MHIPHSLYDPSQTLFPHTPPSYILSPLIPISQVEARLGSGPTGSAEIKGHAWFADYDWDKVMRKEYTPEFSPGTGKGADYDGSSAEHFDEEFTNEKAIDSVVNTQLSATMVEKSKFEGFTFAGGALDGIEE